MTDKATHKLWVTDFEDGGLAKGEIIIEDMGKSDRYGLPYMFRIVGLCEDRSYTYEATLLGKAGIAEMGYVEIADE